MAFAAWRFQRGTQTKRPKGLSDRITDFKPSDGDYIDLSRIDANARLAGDQAFSMVKSFSKKAGEATYDYNAATKAMTFRGDINGDGFPDFELQVPGGGLITKGWVL